MILDNEPCKPFDKNRHGLNLGEGAAYVVMESREHAEQRGVQPICQLTGYANRCDAYHQTASSPEGEGAFRAMQAALQSAQLQPGDIDYINAHGTGTPNNDESEGKAMMRVFGDKVPLVSSTKAYTGHPTSAAGAIESVISILALTRNFVPANLNFSEKIDSLNFTPVTQVLTDVELKHVLCNSFGFGGNDSSCIFSKVS
jgi:3-oxoacyl-[acyl-carrier-protein] synthase-1